MPPPSAGGVVTPPAARSQRGRLHGFDLAKPWRTASTEAYHDVFAEAMRRVYADRNAKLLADPDFAKIPIEELLLDPRWASQARLKRHH